MGHTVIQIPVPALEPLVRHQLTAEMPDLARPDDTTVCAHITALGPFVDERDVDDPLLASLAELFAAVRPFAFDLVDVRRFPDGPTYLAPVPREPFRELTARLAHTYPAWPPYGGAFDDVVPHLSLGTMTLAEAHAALGRDLPVRAWAGEAHLTWWSPTSVRILARFPLGDSSR